jgi:hypothetical protein
MLYKLAEHSVLVLLRLLTSRSLTHSSTFKSLPRAHAVTAGSGGRQARSDSIMLRDGIKKRHSRQGL